jgi:radical SAM superfamily enzyme YgiQ (UPF0313 family)
MKLYFDAVKEAPLFGEIKKPWASVITSRGCHYACVFCTAHLTKGRKWRFRSPENVVDELEHLVDIYGIKQVAFNDDNMTLDKNRMGVICDLIVERGLDIDWYTPNGIRADTLDEKLLVKMKKSGCKRIYIAPESGVQRIVDQVIKKNMNLKYVEKAVALSRKVGIKVSCFFVIGFIGETKEDIKASIKYAERLKRLGADRFYFSYAMPLYGTELYQQAKEGGFLKDDFNDEVLSAVEPVIETSEFTKDDLRNFSMQANLINPIFTRDRLLRAFSNPKGTLKMLFSRVRSEIRGGYTKKN